jgi:hypothetical protein
VLTVASFDDHGSQVVVERHPHQRHGEPGVAMGSQFAELLRRRGEVEFASDG